MMYYEEKVINDVLCWRHNSQGEFVALTPKQLTTKILRLREDMKTHCDKMEELIHRLR
jgi:hypothetical protein